MGYLDKENDIVWICPNNTKGKVITISGLKVGLPKQPPKEDILFHDFPKKEQMWIREEMPIELQEFDTDEEYQDMPREFKDRWNPWIENQFKKRRDGVWFYNNGVPTYLTGKHWFALQWTKQDFGYPLYLQPQAKLEYHWAACVIDPRCYGQNLVKNRRFGWSTLAGSEMLEEITRTKDAIGGILSKTSVDAKDVVFKQKIVTPFNRLPFFFKPLTDGTTDPKKVLSLRPPSTRITKNQKKRKNSQGLNSEISWLATANNSYDGFKLKRLIHDESGKYEKPNNIRKSWQVQKRCLEVRDTIIGKCRMGSTVNPMDKGGSEYKLLFEEGMLDSDGRKIKGRNLLGQTISGLYSIFIPAFECIIYDKYGNSVIEDPLNPIETIDGHLTDIGGKTMLERKRESLKDDAVAYNEEIRQMPFTIREAFMDTLDGCVFNLQKIEEQLSYNDTLYPSPFRRGNLRWANGVLDSKVVWEDDSKSGRFLVVWFPPPEQTSVINTRKTPPNGWMGVGGVDSYDIDQTAYGSGSKGSLHLYNKANPIGASNMFVLEYVSRPKTANEFYEDCLMAAVYYGYPLLIESAKYSIAHYFLRRGYGDYLLGRPYESFNVGQSITAAERKKKGLPVSQETIRQLDMLLEDYVEHHVGYNEDGEIGNLYFNETLTQLKEYDSGNRTKSDAVVSAGHALYAARMDIRKKVERAEKKPLFRRYKLG